MLGTDQAAGVDVRTLRDVAGGEHRSARTSGTSSSTTIAVVARDAGVRGELDVRLDADADDDEVGGIARPARADDGLDASGPLEALDALAEAEVDAVVAMDLRVDAADLVAEHALQRNVEHLDDRDLAAEHAGRRRDLGPDEARRR